jgi:SAM-dependent methyltransferase
MTSGDYLDFVRKQYEELPYPPRDPQDEHRRLVGCWFDSLALINHYCFAGRCDFRGGFRALVAGGGTGDATIFLAEELKTLGGEVVYLDISRSSMEIAQARATVRGLTNIRWSNASILDLPNLDLGRFDYINCTGVLHHLADPTRGLRALASTLKPDGGALIMVYGSIGRTSIYQLQELLRYINATAEDARTRIDHAKRLLADLPGPNWFNHNRAWCDSELATDIGIYDLLLHGQDRAYTVPELYRWMEESGLRVANLMSPCRAAYLPGTYISDPELLTRLWALDLPSQYAASELIAGNLARHFAYCGFGDPKIARIDELDNVPFILPHQDDAIFDALYDNPGKPIAVNSPHQAMRISLQPGRYSLDIFKYLDGTRSLREIFQLIREDRAATGKILPDADLLADFAPIYEQLNAVDMLVLRHQSVAPFPTHDWQRR